MLVLETSDAMLKSGYTIDESGVWSQETQGVTFNGSGPKIYSLTNGTDYGGDGRFVCSLGEVVKSYTVLDNPAEYSVNFLIQVPSSGSSIYEAQLGVVCGVERRYYFYH